eukprot:6212407-Pleurochrysis_carterae.AAC.2
MVCRLLKARTWKQLAAHHPAGSLHALWPAPTRNVDTAPQYQECLLTREPRPKRHPCASQLKEWRLNRFGQKWHRSCGVASCLRKYEKNPTCVQQARWRRRCPGNAQSTRVQPDRELAENTYTARRS